MAGVWNTAQLDLLLPSNGVQACGSGTVYIGGPQLPSDLILGGYTNGVVFWSTPTQCAQGVEYFFIAQRAGLWVLGMKPTVGLFRETVRMGWDGSEWITRVISPGAADRSTLLLSENYWQAIAGSSAGDTQWSIIKGSAQAGQDTWISSVSSRTVAGVANVTCSRSYRVTPDYWVDFRFAFQFPSAPAVRQWAVTSIIDPLVSPDANPVQNPKGIAHDTAGGVYACEAQPNGTLVFIGPASNPGGLTEFRGQLSYSIAKP